MKSLLASTVLVLLALGPARAEDESPAYRIVNVVDDFLAYHREAKDLDAAGRAAAWDRLLESRHPDFFSDSIYRAKEGEEREEFKRARIAEFWADFAPRIDEIAKRTEGIEETIHDVVREFRRHLPDFRGDADFFVTISFSYRGKVMKVGDRDALAIGIEKFGPDDDLSLRVTIAHELFHLFHFRSFNAGGGLYRTLWAEGLATYASAVVVPGHRRSDYLGFPAEKMNRCADLLTAMAADLKKHMGENDPRLKRVYFGAEDNDTRVPPEAGYYVGLLIAESLGRETPLPKLARLPAEEVFRLVAAELARLAEDSK